MPINNICKEVKDKINKLINRIKVMLLRMDKEDLTQVYVNPINSKLKKKKRKAAADMTRNFL